MDEYVVWIQSNLAILISTVAAIATTVTAYVSYHNRAIRIEILREHTKSLRDIANEWCDELPDIDVPSVIVGYGIDVQFDFYVSLNKMSVKLPVQDRMLFVDLYDHHLPPELEIDSKWNDFRNLVDDVMGIRREIRSYLSSKLQTTETVHLFDGPFMNELYRRIVLAVNVPYEYVEYSSLNFSSNESLLILNESLTFSVDDPQIALDFVSKAHEIANKDEELASMVKRLIALTSRCEDARNKLYAGLKDIPHYPILPGRCKYLKTTLMLKPIYRLSKWSEQPTFLGHRLHHNDDSVKQAKRAISNWSKKER